jgi:uncharacterized protein (TIGR00369 family)
MALAELFSEMPFAEHLGIEVKSAEDGVAEARMPMTDELSSRPSRRLAHGGATFALADTVGGAAVVSLIGAPAPTVDMRIDYLEPATEDLVARAEVVRSGDTSAVAEVTVSHEGGEDVAHARGVFKIGVEDDSEHSVKDRH